MRKRKYTALKENTRRVFSHSSQQQEVLQVDNFGMCVDDGVPQPEIHNIVSTAHIATTGKNIDLDRVCELLPASSYDRKKFAAMTIRLTDPNCTILLFSSGKLVVTGGKTWYESILSCLYVKSFLQRNLVGQDFRLIACDVQNIVAHVEVANVEKEFLDLDAMYTHLNVECTYQKQMFPGLIYRPRASPVVLLCFISGKIVITGGKSEKDVIQGWILLWPTVKAFVSKKKTGEKQRVKQVNTDREKQKV